MTRITQIRLLPGRLSVDALKEAKEEFRLWIESDWFRELIETFHVFLGAICLACLKFKLGKREVSLEKLKREHLDFSRQGFPNKLDILSKEYSIAAKHRDHLVSLNGARNVFTHRLGVVRNKDLNAGEHMCVSWLGADTFIEESYGTQHPIEEVIAHQRSFPEETTLMMQFSARARDFTAGQRRVLFSRGLAEICWFLSQEARTLIAAFIEHAKQEGVEVHAAETQQMPAVDAGNPRG